MLKQGQSHHSMMLSGWAEASLGWIAQVGGYCAGQRRGCGIYSFPNGDRYEGECATDAPHGHGVYRFAASGAVLEGSWDSGAKHGWAVVTVGSQQSYGARPFVQLPQPHVSRGYWNLTDGNLSGCLLPEHNTASSL